MSDPLTAGAVQTIFSGGTVANPVLQVIDNKLIVNAGSLLIRCTYVRTVRRSRIDNYNRYMRSIIRVARGRTGHSVDQRDVARGTIPAALMGGDGLLTLQWTILIV